MKYCLVAAAFLLTISSGAALAQVSAPDYSALTAQSAALSPADQARAKQLFATAFSLWQSGDFAAAELAFKQGLDIDPANAQANYYYGDCLARRKDKADAKVYLSRAVALGNGSPEGFKAQAELQQLSVAPTNVADMTPDELTASLAGSWAYNIQGRTGVFNIVAGSQGLDVVGRYSYFLASCEIKGKMVGDRIDFTCGNTTATGRAITAQKFEGTWNGAMWSAEKQ